MPITKESRAEEGRGNRDKGVLLEVPRVEGKVNFAE